MAKKSKHYKSSEDREVDEAYRQITGKKPAKKQASTRNSGFAVVVCIALAAIIICCGSLLFYMIHTEMNRIIQANVSIAGIQVQGMTQIEAIRAVDSSYKPKDLTVTVLEHSVVLPSRCVTGLNTRKVVRDACNLENSITPHSMDLTPYLKLDEELIRNTLATFGDHFNTTLQQSTYQILGNEPEQTLQITLGVPEHGLDLQTLYRDVLTAFGKGIPSLEGQCTTLVPDPINLDAISAKYCRPPIDASYDVNSHQMTGGEEGYGFDLEAAKSELAEAKFGATLKIPFSIIKPTITREEAEAALFKDVLGTFTAKSSSQKNRDVNLDLACKAIDGIILYPGDAFSYNKTLGERTPEKGYKPAGTYVGNETVNTYGGGICQVSSSLYYSALCAELKITERTNHGFLPSYMPRGLDATVNWGTLDFRFKNNLDYPIRIEAKAKGGTTTVSIVGTETRSYHVKLDATVISKTAYETEYRQMDPNNQEGYKDGDVIISPYTGYNVESYLYKYDNETNKLLSKSYIDDSKYRVRNKVVCKIESDKPDDQPDIETPTTPPPLSPEEIPAP